MDASHHDSEEHRSGTLTYKPQSFAEVEWEVIDISEKADESFEAVQFEVVDAPLDDFNPMFPDFSRGEFVEDPLLAPYKPAQPVNEFAGDDKVQKEIDDSAQEGSSNQEASPIVESAPDETEQTLSTEDSTLNSSLVEHSDDDRNEAEGPSELHVDDAIEEHEPLQATLNEDDFHEENAVATGEVESALEDVVATEMDGAIPLDELQVDDTNEESQEEDCQVSEADTEEMTLESDPLQDAFEAGYQKGVEESREELQYTQQQLTEQYTLLWEDMQVQLDEVKADHEQKAVELAMHVARKLMGKVMDEHPEYVVDVIHEALESISNATIKVVRVSPQSYEFLSLGEYGERIKIHGDQKLSFKADESIRAGCIVETSAGETDFDLEKTWTRICEKVVGGAKA